MVVVVEVVVVDVVVVVGGVQPGGNAEPIAFEPRTLAAIVSALLIYVGIL